MNTNILYIEYLKKLKKANLVNLINLFHKYCLVYNYPIIEHILKENKNDLIDYLCDIKEMFVKFVIQSLDIQDFNLIKEIIKKSSIFDIDKNLVEYLNNVGILFSNEMPVDIFKIIKKLIKNKSIAINIGKNQKLYTYIKGIIVAYGVVNKSKFYELVDEENIQLIDLYYKKDFKIEDKGIISINLKSKKRVNKYLKDKFYKEFTKKDFMNLGSNIYHHKIKSYKKLIRILKKNYIFKNHDIMFIDNNIVIPYLYNSLADLDKARELLEENINYYFEFNENKLKELILENIVKVKEDFPVWEYRGKNCNEVK